MEYSSTDSTLQGAVKRDSCPWSMVHTNKAFVDDIEDPVYHRDQTSDAGRSNPGADHHSTLPSRSTMFQENLPPDATTSSSTTKVLDNNRLPRSTDSSVILSTAQPPVADTYASLFKPGVSTEPDAYQETCPRPIANSDLLIQMRRDLDDHSGSDGGGVGGDPAPGFPAAGRHSVGPEFRLVSKCGRRNISGRVNRATRCGGYARDVFTTLVDLEWKYHVVIWMASFCLSWIGFGFIWWFTITDQPGVEEAETGNDTNSTPADRDSSFPPAHSCLARVQDFAGAFLFSIETQSTIGYGWRYINSDCHPLGYILLFVQILSGVCIAFFLSGVIFKKLSRPYGRASTILFSRNAVIQADGSDLYRFAFRLGDIRKSHVIGTSIRALLVKDRLTKEGERIPLCQYPLQLDTQSSISDSFIFMPWPIIVSHRIDENSPLWTVSEISLRRERFEIIVMFEGVVESTGASTQLRTSYLPSEILWGREFVVLPTVEKTDCNGHVSRYVDFGDFDRTVPTVMDSRSAKEFSTRDENQNQNDNRDIPIPLMTSESKDEFQNEEITRNDDDENMELRIPDHCDRDKTGTNEDNGQQHQTDEEQLEGSVSSRLKWKGKRFHTVGQHPCNERQMKRRLRTDEAAMRMRRTYSF